MKKININDSILKRRGSSAGSNGTQYKDRQNPNILKKAYFCQIKLFLSERKAETINIFLIEIHLQQNFKIIFRFQKIQKIINTNLYQHWYYELRIKLKNIISAVILELPQFYVLILVIVNLNKPCLLQGLELCKEIENNVSKNIVGFDNDESLNRVIKDYETQIEELKRARVDDEQQYEKMLKIIKNLEEQRKNIKSQFKTSDHIQAMIKKNYPYQWMHLYYLDVGMLLVPVKGSRDIEVKQDIIDSFGMIKIEEFRRRIYNFEIRKVNYRILSE